MPTTPSTTPPPTFDVKTLCILPHFDGNPNNLYDFIKVSVTLLNHYFDTRPEHIGCIQNVLILQGIISKLTGRAKEVVSIFGCDDWEQIKDTLIQNFGDQRDENSLTRDLVNMKQLPSESFVQFYERVMGLLNTTNNYVELHNSNQVIKTSKKTFFKQQALTTFLAGLREPIGSVIRAMRPTSLPIAMQYIQEELNIRYLQGNHNTTNATPGRPTPEITKQQQHFAPRFYQPNVTQQPRINHFTQQPRFNHFQNQNQSRFPQGPIQMNPRPNYQQPRFPTNQQVFGRPQNVWKPNPQAHQQQPRPTPMSTTSRQTVPRTFTQQRPLQNYAPPKPTERLFNIEQEDPTTKEEQYPEEHGQEEQDYYYTQEAFAENAEDASDEQDVNFHYDLYPDNET